MNDLDRYNKIVDIFHKESDRAAALLAASYLEVLLESLLRKKLIKGPVTDQLFEQQGPLSSFSSRIALSYVLGLIPEHTYHDLTKIRQIRNHFAHHMDEASFEEPAVRDRCSELTFVKRSQEGGYASDVPQDARTRFLLSVAGIVIILTKPEGTYVAGLWGQT